MLLVSAHLGGWEVATALPRAFVPVRTTAIVTDDWIAWAADAARARVGLGRLYDTEPASRAARLLRAGEAVLVLGDYAKSSMRTYPVRLLDAVIQIIDNHTVRRLTGLRALTDDELIRSDCFLLGLRLGERYARVAPFRSRLGALDDVLHAMADEQARRGLTTPALALVNVDPHRDHHDHEGDPDR